MTLKELAGQYNVSAEKLAKRIDVLKEIEERLPKGRERMLLGNRIRALSAMCMESRTLAGHMDGYYDRRRKRNASYTL